MILNIFLVLVSLISINSNPIEDQNYDLNSVEYPNIGVFHRTDFFDLLHRPVVFLPQSPARIGTRFLLFTPNNPKDEQHIFNDNQTSIKNSNFDPKLETKFIVHGFFDDLVIGGWMKQIKDNYLKLGKYNVIIVDWSQGNEPPYGQATVNTRIVGALIANLVQDLKSVHSISYDSVHIIGHSLGSHIAGYAGERLKTLGRITGLDPAGPFFQYTVPACRLDPTDAQFVDSLHTNSHIFGMEQEVSHLDIYPNGGDNQPKCGVDHNVIKILTDGAIEGVKQLFSCNHQRAIDYFIESMTKTNPPIAYECKDYNTFLKGQCTECGPNDDLCAFVGPKVEEWKKFRKTGTYVKMYFTTKGESPYLLSEYAVQVKLSEVKKSDEHGVLYITLNGNQIIQLSKEDEILRLGQTYNYMMTTEKELGDMQSLIFKWHHKFSLFSSETYVDNISISPMFVSDKAERTKESVKYCSPDPNSPISHDKQIVFNKC